MHSHLEARVEQLRRRAAAAVWVAAVGRGLAIGIVALASLALLLRGGLEWSSAQAAWLLAPLVLVPPIAWLAVRGRAPGAGDGVAWLDLRARAGGLLLTLRERPDERWRVQVEEQLARLPEAPRIGITRIAPRLLACIAFAMAALFVPLPRSSAAPPPAFFERLAGELLNEITTLAANVALDPELSTELLERADGLIELATETTDGNSFLEAFDGLSERVAGIASTSAMELVEADGALARLSAAAIQNPELALNVLQKARPLLQALDATGQLPPELQAALGAFGGGDRSDGGATLSAGELLGLAAGLSGSAVTLREDLRQRLGALRAAGLLGGLEPAAGLANAGREAGDAGSAGAPGEAGSTVGGDSGGGSPPLWWGEEARAALESFTPRALPRGERADPAHSAPIGVLPSAPEVLTLPDAGAVVAGENSQSPSAPLRAAWQRELAPRHRAAVRAFFQPSPRTGN